MISATGPADSPPRKVSPDELTEGFRRLNLEAGDSIVMHASLNSIGVVDGGAAMVLHRLLRVLGKDGTLLMPTFTSITRHSVFHDGYMKPGCWCEGREDRHLPFIPELQPDRDIGEIAKRLCSWPASRRSKHPAYSYVAVGKHEDDLVKAYSLDDPLLALRRFLKHEPTILTIGVGFDSMLAVHLAEQRRIQEKFVRERALSFTSKGRTWVDITAFGCAKGFEKLRPHLDKTDLRETRIGLATAQAYPMEKLIECADSLLERERTALLCSNPGCLNCAAVRNRLEER